MTILALGNALRTIEEEEFVELSRKARERQKKRSLEEIEADAENDTDTGFEPTNPNQKKKNPQKTFRGGVIVAGSKEAAHALEVAGILFDGDTNPANIEFCKVEVQQECLAGTMRIPRLTDVDAEKIRMHYLLNTHNIVIIDDSGFAMKIIGRIKSSKKNQGQTRERFLYNFIAEIMSRDLGYLGHYERQIMKLEDDVINNYFEDFSTDLPQIRKELLILREYYDELRDMGKQLEEDENRFFAKKNLKFFGTISDRADRLMNRSKHLLDYIGQVRDIYQQKVAEQENKNMQFLTVVSTIFLPLTLITGWYGMNFQNMPELRQGYPYVITLSVVVIIVIIIIFKKRKIM